MRRILVVDDDLHVSQAIRLWLEHYGFRVSTADGGPNGLAALDNGTFDLMIVDVFMPPMRGFEAIRLFHARAPAVPLVAISGYAFAEQDLAAPEFLRLATRLGATRCLRKPFQPATLLDVIDECLSQAEPHQRQLATLGAVVEAATKSQAKRKSTELAAMSPEAGPAERAGGRVVMSGSAHAFNRTTSTTQCRAA